MKKYFLLLLILPVLALSACSLNKEEITVSEDLPIIEESTVGRKEFTAYDHTFSYEGDGEVAVENLKYFFDIELDGTYVAYDDSLTISDNLYWPYGIYQDFDANKVRYNCDGTFLKASYADGLKYLEVYLPQTLNSPAKFIQQYISDDNRWAYCETNGSDYLKQFEFGAISGFEPITTGGGVVYSWYVIYSKNIDGINYFFVGGLDGEGLWVLDPEQDQKYCVEDEECYSVYSKEYLDILLADEENQEKLAEWDKFVESVELVK